MRESIFYAALLTTSCMGAITSASAQTIYTDRAAFEAATIYRTVTTFEGVQFDEGGAAGSKFLGREFAGNGYSISNNEFMSIVDPRFSSYNYNSGNVLTVADGTGTITVGAGFSAFGFDYGKGSTGSGPTDLFINGTSYTSLRPNLGFFGIVGTAAIAPISFRINGGIGVFDNITMATAASVVTPDPVNGAVPEPATWAMMILGFGAVGGAMRRRRVRTSVRFA